MRTNLLQTAIDNPTWPDRRTQIPQVRIEVNFKCGKACFYCRPTGEGVALSELKDVAHQPLREMTVDELVQIVQLLTRHGVTDFKLTGGDPMLRSDIVSIVRQLKAIPTVKSLHLVTRHHRAGELAYELKDAGLDLLNFSLDSLESNTWTRITRVKGHNKLVNAIRQASETGIAIKINTVVLKGINDHEIPALVEFAGECSAELKLLDLINDIGITPAFDGKPAHHYYTDLVPVAEWLATKAESWTIVTQPGGLGHPMPSFYMPNGATVTVKSARFGAYYGSICTSCPLFPCWDALMALRVTPNGMLQYCLLRSDNLIDVLSLLQSPSPADADTAVKEALRVYRNASPYTGAQVENLRKENFEIPTV